MLTWIYELLKTFVSYILSLFSIQLTKKNVSFADEVAKDNDVTSASNAADNTADIVADNTE
jgi:hypothetical protein